MKTNPSIKILLKDHEGIMFEMSSSTREGVKFIVNVFFDERGWFCNCEYHRFRKHDCKHIIAAKNIMSDWNED